MSWPMAPLSEPTGGSAMAQPTDIHYLRLFLLESVVLFPGMELPLVVFEPRYRELTQECQEANEPFGVLLLQAGREVGGTDVAPYQVGTTAHIEQVDQLPDGRLHVSGLGRDRFRVVSFNHDRPYLAAQVEYLPKDAGNAVPGELVQRVRDAGGQYLRAIMALRGGYIRDVPLPEDPEELSYILAMLFQGQRWTQQRLLEATTTAERLTQESQLLQDAYNQMKDRVAERWSDRGSRRN